MGTQKRAWDLTLEEARSLLGVAIGAPPETVRRAYHEAVRRWHPDLHAHDAALQRAAEERTKDLNRAYQMLMASIRPPTAPPRAPVSPLHAAYQVYRCARCGRLACARCLTRRGCVSCPRERPRDRLSPTLGWLLLLGWVGLAFMMNYPPGLLLLGLWGLLGAVGTPVLLRLGLRALPLWFVFPVSLPIAGAWWLLNALSGGSRRS